MMSTTNGSGAPSSALAVIGPERTPEAFRMALEPQNFDAAWKVAAMAAKIQLCGVTTPEDALVRMMTGRELGLTAFQSMRLIYVVDGRPGLDSSLILALCNNHPSCEYFELLDTSDERATYEAKRKGRPPVKLSWTIDQAKKAGLLDRGQNPAKNNWNRYPAAMLRARCVSALARIVLPEAIAGLRSREEIADEDDLPEPPRARGVVVDAQTGEVLASAAAPAGPPQAQVRDLDGEAVLLKERIAAATTKEARSAVRAAIAAWSKEVGEPWAGDVQRFYNMTVGAPPSASSELPVT